MKLINWVKLAKLVKRKDVEGVKKYIEEFEKSGRKFDFNRFPKYKRHTLLTYACKYACCDMVRMFAAMGADIEQANDKTLTPLLEACKNKAQLDDVLRIIEFLTESGCNINLPDKSGRTPLMYASQHNTSLAPAVVKYLVEHGADAGAMDRTGANALMHCCGFGGSPQTAEYLISIGSNIECTAADKTYQWQKGDTPLVAACKNRRWKVCEVLLEHGANVNVVNMKKENALLIAYRQDNPNLEIIKMLITSGVNINMQINGTGNSLLIDAIQNNKTDPLKYLLITLGADPNIQNNRGKTALHYAIHDVDFELVEHLINAGADINIIDKYGETPLFSLLPLNYSDEDEKRLKMAEYLVEHGGNPFLKNKHGGTFIEQDDAIIFPNGTPHRQVLAELWSKCQGDYEETDILIDREW